MPDPNASSPSPSIRQRIVEVVLVAAVPLIVVALLLSSVGVASPAARRAQCKNNLKQIELALHNYHDTWDSFPPAITYGPDGKPWHSWRVLLVQFLESNDWQVRYRFDEPWNGPNNRGLAEEVGDFSYFRCPSDENAAPGETSYVAIIGEGTMWPPHGAATLDDAKDGTERTLHVVEVSDSGVHWMQPVDLHLDAMTLSVGAKQGVGIRGRHGGTERWFREDDPTVANVGMVDGSVRALDSQTLPETVRSLLLRNDGKPADP